MKINRKEIMKRAHEIAKKMVGDWYARLALALRQAWMEAKTVVSGIAIEVRIGIIKSVFENEKRFEGFAIIDGVRKELTPDLLKELQLAKSQGRIKGYTRFWLNDKGNPLRSC